QRPGSNWLGSEAEYEEWENADPPRHRAPPRPGDLLPTHEIADPGCQNGVPAFTRAGLSSSASACLSVPAGSESWRAKRDDGLTDRVDLASRYCCPSWPRSAPAGKPALWMFT